MTLLQGHVIANHLETQDLVDVSLYARHAGARHDDTVESWTEVFPTSRCHQQVEPLVPGYIPPTDARWFLVLVASASIAIVYACVQIHKTCDCVHTIWVM